MARKVFYSFHYIPDCSRAAQIRNMGVLDGNVPATDNDWETVTKGGDAAIQRWINSQMNGKSCAVVLIGSATAGRKWINYEITKAWTEKKGVVGIYVNNLKDLDGYQSTQGKNPFDSLKLKSMPLSSIVKAYSPPYADSKMCYSYIQQNLARWIEEAISIRAKY